MFGDRTGRRVMLFRNFFIALLVTVSINAAHAAPRWLSLPPTPTLPKAAQSGFAPVNGIKVWYAMFGRGGARAVAAWRPRQRQLLGPPGPRAATALSGHR